MASGTIGDKVTAGNNVTGAVADYGSSAEWHATLGTNETATGTIIRINAAVDTSPVTLSASGTGTRTLTAHTDAAVNAPTYANGTSRARIDGSSYPMLSVSDAGWVVEKIGVRCTSDAIPGIAFSSGGTFRRCVAIFDSAGTSYGFRGSGGAVVVSNCALIGGKAATIYSTGGTLDAYHVSGITYDFRVFENYGGTSNAYACVANGGSTGSDFNGWGGDYNVSSDTSAPGSAATKYARSSTGWFTLTTAGSENLALAAGKQGWWASNKDAIDQTGWPSDVGTDIVGTTRAAPIDPGVWQTPAAGGGGMLKRFAWLGGLGRPVSSLTGGLHG